jgi:hypothetical protein
LVVILVLAALLAAVGVLGDRLAVSDSVLLAGWLAAGVAYYQVLRFPRAVVAGIASVRGGYATNQVAVLPTDQRSSSET